MDNGKRGIKWLKIGLLIFLLIALFFVVFYQKHCKDESCFNFYLEKCRKAVYQADFKDSSWQYTILGKQQGKCVVNVKLLLVKEGSQDVKKLEGKDMTCYLEIGSTEEPRSDLKKCHGILKEEMQEIVIQKLHSYVIENIGKISEELQKAI